MSPCEALNPEKRSAGVLAPVFALRHDDDLGCGDVRSLREFIDWAAGHGFRVVQILPINETGGDHSPHNAISSMALDVTTIETHPRAIADLLSVDYEAEIARVNLVHLRAGPVDYVQVKALKWRLLDRAFSRGEAAGAPERQEDFEIFQEAQAAWLDGYTFYRALMERSGGNERFDTWPNGLRSVREARMWRDKLDSVDRKLFERRRRFFAYVQWIAWEQWEAVKRHATERGVALMGDIPIGVSYYGSDYFTYPELFEPGWNGGAPPEPAFNDDLFVQRWGQNWGIPVYDWTAMARDGFAWWRQRVAGVRELFHIFRIDHILGFYRLYSFPWRPSDNHVFSALSPAEAASRTGGRLPQFRPRDDSTPPNCAQNKAQGDVLLRLILDAARPATLVAEDLGTVPAYVRPHLCELGIAGLKIPQWERGEDGRLRPGAEYPRLSITTYATHDYEPLAAMGLRWEQAARDDLAGVPGARARADAARHDAWELGEFAGIPDERRLDGWSDAVHEALVRGLLATNSWLAILMVTDLLGIPERFNLPGVASPENWSRRLSHTAAGLNADPDAAAKMERIVAILRETGRA